MLSSGDFTVSLPRFDYVSQNNNYSGSFGRFRYKMFPLKKEDGTQVIIAAAYQDHCFELEDEAGRARKAEFPYSDEGIDQAEQWIVEQYESLQNS